MLRPACVFGTWGACAKGVVEGQGSALVLFELGLHSCRSLWDRQMV